VTVGTGIGGGLVVGGALYGSERTARPGGPPPATCEIGHLRPGPDAESPQETVESIASGLGMETRARRLLAAEAADPEQSDARFDLLSRCGTPEALSAEHLAEAALDGNELALAIIGDAVRTLGWAIAQVITLLAPDVVVVGGGVSMMPASLFWQPLRDHVATYVFPPLREHAILTRAALQEAVVVHGALALARNAASSGVTPDDGNTPYPRSTRRGGI
ncbi:MAG: ROK family protein, partial [Planctomycetota bacterium]